MTTADNKDTAEVKSTAAQEAADTKPPREISDTELEPDYSPPEYDEDGVDKKLGVTYQRAGQVRQALAEYRNAKGQGNTTRMEAARKVLDGLGYNPPATKDPIPGDKSVDASMQSPEGRSATPPTAVKTDASAKTDAAATVIPPRPAVKP